MSKWINTSDQIPDEFATVWVYYNECVQTCYMSECDGDYTWNFDCAIAPLSEIRYWQPIEKPEAPNQLEGKS